MTALTARRTSFKETIEHNALPENISRRAVTQQQRQRIIDEIYPELSLDQDKKHKVKLQYKTPSLPATIEDACEDEESVAISKCFSSTRSLDGRSPYALPPEELFQHSLLTNQDLFSNPIMSAKFEHRPLRSLRTIKTTPWLSRGFNDSIIRNKRSLSLLGERPSSANFESLSADFLDLPPIPETVPLRKIAEKEGLNSDDEEKEDENTYEILVPEHSNPDTFA
ncbi:Uncharacterized protein BM_BM1812 [Brugia malayi]|uniref:Bm1812 n=1 Tax=Brugia malayi TaxID=6279 RepID=A0A0H5SK46_BRUMA|nr:Uncharacterized protein BM_BM1812 [Brugia malayi]CRZ24166.1 Bm1812 [Brugia malayi]VIO94536.1 Uncharacterized protein BM_BM1812 [Brugia malayi]